MKYITAILSIVFTALLISSCSTPKKTTQTVLYTDVADNNPGIEMTVAIKTGKALNHPTYVLWMEDMSGNYIKTLFITKSYASGIFGHEMVGDTVWLKKPGASYQPAALPYWTFKKGLINNKDIIPTPDNPFTDAYTGATPKGNLDFKTNVKQAKPFRMLMEINQPWDWDAYWTNNKYAGNAAYEHSAQPSLIYAVSIIEGENEFYLNPIGHGDPKGESGRLYTNINTLSTAKNILESISITIK